MQPTPLDLGSPALRKSDSDSDAEDEGKGLEQENGSWTRPVSPGFRPTVDSGVASSETDGTGNVAPRRAWGFREFVLSELSWGKRQSFDAKLGEYEVRLLSFVRLPLSLEKFMLFGFLCCFDVFLHIFTFLPLRCAYSAAALASRWRVFHRSQLYDLVRGAIILMSCVFLSYIQISRVYHYIRGEAIIKLYVIFNILEILDKLCASIGQDALDSLYRVIKTEPKSVGKLTVCTVVAVVYVVVHSLLQFVEIVSLNVAINSKNNALLTLLVSNNFIELKASVFKRFAPENLFQVACSDAVERFQLFVFLCLIMLQDIDSLQSFREFLPMALGVYAGECVVDWVKHSFVVKFNRMRAETYLQFASVLSHDVLSARRRMEGSLDPTHASVRRMGFASLPLACVMVRLVTHRLRVVDWSAWISPVGVAIVVLAFSVLLALKLLISLLMLAYASYIGEGGLGWAGDKWVDDAVRRVSKVSRYSLFASSVPAH